MQNNPNVQQRPWSIQRLFDEAAKIGAPNVTIFALVAAACAVVDQDTEWVPVGQDLNLFITSFADAQEDVRQVLGRIAARLLQARN
jgi:hypothetical protein